MLYRMKLKNIILVDRWIIKHRVPIKIRGIIYKLMGVGSLTGDFIKIDCGVHFYDGNRRVF